MKVRCKFICVETTNNRSGHTASFEPVIEGSKENEKFFKYTPSGKLDISTLKKQSFKAGKEYYLDISTVEKSESEDAE